jgi:hypothetical protein
VTDPLPLGREAFLQPLYLLARFIYRLINKKWSYIQFPKYNGHYAVTRSVCEGLTKTGAAFNYNPKEITELSENVYIPSGIKALKQIISLKKIGIVKKVFTGPNIVIFPEEHNSILKNKEIDGLINHCKYAFQLWLRDNPSLAFKCFEWAAGVDTSYWKPKPHYKKDRKNILIFYKDVDSCDIKLEFIYPYIKYLENEGFK